VGYGHHRERLWRHETLDTWARTAEAVRAHFLGNRHDTNRSKCHARMECSDHEHHHVLCGYRNQHGSIGWLYWALGPCVDIRMALGDTISLYRPPYRTAFDSLDFGGLRPKLG
jgi:hypothetical protein